MSETGIVRIVKMKLQGHSTLNKALAVRDSEGPPLRTSGLLGSGFAPAGTSGHGAVTSRTSEQDFSRPSKGFSLVELLIATFMLTALLGSVLAIFNQQQSRYDFEQDLVATQQSAREVADQVYRDVRMAGYPQQRLYAASLNWTASNSNKIASGFTTISSSNLVFQGDVDNDGLVEVVEYSLSGTTLRRSEVEKNSDGSVPSADPQILAENVTGLVFTYYRWNGSAWTASGVTAANTSRADVSVTLQTASRDPQSKQYRTLNLQTSVIPRNLE
jgi:Tfp pilus assembly protein PilW